MTVYRLEKVQGVDTEVVVFDEIKEATYTGKDMGERKIVATIKWPSPIEFQIGDYVKLDIASLVRNPGAPRGGFIEEKFYIYTLPTIKKTARSMSVGDAFEHTVTFFPRQYELATVMMRDVIQEQTASGIVYTGYDEFSFYGGAKTLLDRIMAVLEERFKHTGTAGVDYWTYDLANEVNEDINTSLEKYQFDFSSNTVLDALVKLSDEQGIDTTFFINERKIYVGHKCAMVCRLDNEEQIVDDPYIFRYGKTSQNPLYNPKATPEENGGGLFNITKSIGTSSPITRLFAYGDTRNLNRFYCSDRLASGRYVNRLMLPSFDVDGKTDFIDSPSGIAKFGIREGKKQFDDIYPSLRYITYGDLRQIKYVLKLMDNGAGNDFGPLCRIQCYKVEPHPNLDGQHTGVNRLVEAWPEEPLVVCVHANGKVNKVILGTNATQQQALDGQNNVPSHDGSCFCVHQGTEYNGSGESSPVTVKRFANYANYKAKAYATRSLWFGSLNESGLTPDQREDLSTFQINYGDDARITDVYLCQFEDNVPLYDEQTSFTRDGYSAYCWPHINDLYTASQSDAIAVNEILGVTPIVQADTDWDVKGGNVQQSFDVYLRDLGFTLNEQTPMGTLVHIVGQTFNLQFLDGNLAGVTFEAAETKTTGSMYIDSICCLWGENGESNQQTFIYGADDPVLAQAAIDKGAVWRIAVRRNDSEYENYGVLLPNQQIQAKEGDHLVFLNIYMPDIYVHAAENRLLKEAQKFLNDNDNGDVNYTAEFDQIRLAQIPQLGLQMREGAIMRIVDSELKIQTEKESRYLFKERNGLLSKKSMIEYVTTEGEKVREYGSDSVEQKYFSIRENQSGGWIINYDDIAEEKILVPQSETPIALTVTQYFLDVDEPVVTKIEPKQYSELVRTGKSVECVIPIPKSIRDSMREEEGMLIWKTVFQLDINYYVETQTIVSTSKYVPDGKTITCNANPVVNFLAGHYYEVVIDIDSSLTLLEDSAEPFQQHFCLASSLNNESNSLYYPEFTRMAADDEKKYGTPPAGYERFVYMFTLQEAFNDALPYYIGVRYVSDHHNTEYATVRLLSIYESNTSDGSTELNYVDLTIDDITIQITSSGREYSLGGSSSSNGGGGSGSSSSSGGSASDNKKITATVKQKQRATVWQQMNAQIKSNSILSEQTQQTAASLAQNARKNVRNLEALKESIFDPDGTITDTFLQTMMLQVGADSMNYSLDKTRVFNGVMTNISLQCIPIPGNPIWNIWFGQADVLRHYVYTNGADGMWVIPSSIIQNLSPDKTYYISIKASRSNSQAVWVVSEEQHKVDEDTNYWYFNYGILLPTSTNTNRVIMETRGNAYMYGDNVIAGKIVTIDGNSYLDLTGNKFKLGNQLMFQNGVLSIGSGQTSDNVNNVLSRLGLAEVDIDDLETEMETKATTALVEQVRDDLQAQIDGAISTYFMEDEPTLTTPPVMNSGGSTYDEPWLTGSETPAERTAILNNHVGDLYYDKLTGHGYRFMYDDDEHDYLWTELTDEDVTEALRIANEAKATADGKMTAFSSAPTDKAYKVGDMWVQGSTGQVLYSINNREAGQYQASDWVSASLYAETLAMLESGAENIVGESGAITIQGSGTHYHVPLVGDLNPIEGATLSAINPDYLKPNTKYVFSFEKAQVGGLWPNYPSEDMHYKFRACLLYKDASGVVQAPLVADFDVDHSGTTYGKQYAVFTTPALPSPIGSATKCAFIVYPGIPGYASSNMLILTNPMVQEGEKPSAYTSYTHHLTEALKGTTDIAGGLVMTNILMLKDSNNNVKAGMSGLASENVLLWGGGEYKDALAAIGGSTPLPVLLTKTGTGSRIGCFKVEDDEEIAVHDGNDSKRVIVTSKSINDIGSAIPSSILIQSAAQLCDYVRVNQEGSNISGNKTILTKNFTATATGNVKVTVNFEQESRTGATWTSDTTTVSGGIQASASIGGITVRIKYAGIQIGTAGTCWPITSGTTTSASSQYPSGNPQGGYDTTLQTSATASAALVEGFQYTLEIVATDVTVMTMYMLATGSAIAEYKITALTDIKAVYVDMRTFICKDGLSVVVNSDLQFTVSNDGTYNTMIINGLPTSDPGNKGQLWKSGGYLRISNGS